MHARRCVFATFGRWALQAALLKCNIRTLKVKHSDSFTFTAYDFSNPSHYYSINCVMRSSYYFELPGWTEENHKKTSAIIAGSILAEIQTGDLPNISLECYHYTTLYR